MFSLCVCIQEGYATIHNSIYGFNNLLIYVNKERSNIVRQLWIDLDSSAI